MKHFKLRFLVAILGLGISASSLRGQDTITNENSAWDWIIGTCFMLPNDTDLRSTFDAYFGVQGEAHKGLKDNFYLGANAVLGFGNASNEQYTIRATQIELMPYLVYKIDKFEIGAGPVLVNLKLKEEYNGTKDDFSTSGLGLGGKAKYILFEGVILDIAIFGAYSKVKPSDDDIDIELGTTKFGIFFLFK